MPRAPKKLERRRTRRRKTSPSRLEWLKWGILAIKPLHDLLRELLNALDS